MKKYVLVILVGVLCLFSGMYLYGMQKNNNQDVIPAQSNLLTKEEASILINDTLKNVINVYESKNDIFKIEKQSNNDEKLPQNEEESDKKAEDKEQNSEEEIPSSYVKVTNYDEVVKGLFTENGIKELESTSFSKNNFVIKNENDVYLYDEIPQENQYKKSNITLGTIDIKEKEISCEVTLSTYIMGEDEILTYYVIVKNLKLIKEGDNWLVDTFSYKND